MIEVTCRSQNGGQEELARAVVLGSTRLNTPHLPKSLGELQNQVFINEPLVSRRPESSFRGQVWSSHAGKLQRLQHVRKLGRDVLRLVFFKIHHECSINKLEECPRIVNI